MNRSTKAIAGLIGSLSSLAAQAHPGVHHLNGVGHSIPFADEITLAAVAVWGIAMVGLFAKLWFKRARQRA